MSNVGQGVLAVAGGIIGFYVGGAAGAAYGFQLGLAVGTVVSPTQLPGTFGPRLTDNKTTTSQIGAPVTQVFGMDAVAGVVTWVGDVVEHENTESSGKGSPEQDTTTYSYTQSIAIGLCAGPMGGIRRIWENGKLVFDRRPQLEGEDDVTFANRISASDYYENGFSHELPYGLVVTISNGFTLYLGDEDQLPDPTIELKEGVGNVPAFRGLMYIVFPDRKLRDDQGRRHPSFKFEVFEAGTTECEIVRNYEGQRIYTWDPSGPDPRNQFNAHNYQVMVNNSPGDTFETLDQAMDHAQALTGRSFGFYIGWSSGSSPSNLDITDDPPELDRVAEDRIFLHYSSYEFIDSFKDASVPLSCSTTRAYYSAAGQSQHFAQGTAPAFPNSFTLLSLPNSAPGAPEGYDEFINCGGSEPTDYKFAKAWCLVLSVTRRRVAPLNPCVLFGESTVLPGYARDPQTGLYLECGEWAAVDVSGVSELVLADTLSDNDFQVTPNTVNYSSTQNLVLTPAMRSDDPNNTEAFWTAAYNDAVARGLLPSGYVYASDYPLIRPIYEREFNQCTITTDRVSIASIVSRICEKVKLTDYDVSDLEAVTVNGYQISRVMDARSAIAPLRSVGFFDAVESAGTLKFPTRGKPSVRTLLLEDLGAHAFDSDVPAASTTKKMQDVELPRQLFVQYRDPDRDYETAEQASPTRLTTDAVNDVYVDVAVAIDATQAVRAAEVIWADQWAARWQHQIALDCSQVDIEPADCFTIPVDDRNERVRAISIEDSAVILRQFQLVRDDDGTYVSTAVADPPAVTPSTISIYAQTELILMDLPALRHEDNDGGIYIAARPVANWTWGGAVIARTIDGGTSFTEVGSVTARATTGLLDSAPTPGDWHTWDDTNEIIVQLQTGTLESRPDADVLDGANAIAVGEHGRWLLVQFANAEQIDATRWRLTRLLWGRRGTEHLIGTSETGDSVVLVSGSGVIRAALPASQIGQSVQYRAITLNTAVATGTLQTLISSGVALLPFSPVDVNTEVDSSGDVLITWLRRDRLGQMLVSGTGLEMSEVTLAFEVDIYSLDSPPAFKRTLTTASESATYTEAQQITDFGSPTTDVLIEIYQMSAVVGRGTPAEVLT